MIPAFQKVEELIIEKNFDKAIRLLISSVNNQLLSNNIAIEEFFSYLVILHEHRKALPYLKINKVPPRPLDLNFDIGRRFFYYLQILNLFGAKKLIYPYLEDIVVSRPLEYRFMGSLHHVNNDFEISKKYYKKGYELVIDQDNFSRLHHPQLFNNYLAGCVYTKDFKHFWDSVEYFSNYSPLKKTTYPLLVEQYKCLVHALEGNTDKSQKLYSKIYTKDFTDKIPASFSYICALTNGLYKLTQEDPNATEYIKSCGEHIFSHMVKNEISPTKFLSFYYFFEAQLDLELNLLGNRKYYPLPSFKILNREFGSQHFDEFGDNNAPFFINVTTQEYSLGTGLSIRLPAEVKSIYYLTLAGDVGLNAEELSSLIHDDLDYSGLFLINNRIKQIIHRIKTKYNMQCNKINGRIILGEESRNKIKLLTTKKLTITNQFNLKQFCEHYNISRSKSLKIITSLSDEGFITKQDKNKFAVT